MPNPPPPADLTAPIQQLLDERQRHADALAAIDRTLFGIVAALENAASDGRAEFEVATGLPGLDADAEAKGEAAWQPQRPQGTCGERRYPAKGRRTRGSYATTGEESVLDFIKKHKNPTTKEIKGHWAGEGRKGTADNVLSKLFREKRVKRKALASGERGSRYSLT